MKSTVDNSGTDKQTWTKPELKAKAIKDTLTKPGKDAQNEGVGQGKGSSGIYELS